MNCKIVLTQLDDYIDQQLQPHLHQQVSEHIADCSACHQAWQQELQFRDLLKEYPVPVPAAGFENRLFAALPRQQQTHRKAFAAGFGGAIAAGLLLFVVANVFWQPVVQQDAVPNITLALHQSKKVNMVFDVPEAVADATFSMQLPSHVEIAGYKGLNKIEWKTALKKGKNLLSLPIVAKSAEQGELVAVIKYGNKQKEFRMKLDIQSIEQGLINLMKHEQVG